MTPSPQQLTQQLLALPEPDLRNLLRKLEHNMLRDALWALRSLALLQAIVAQLSPAAASLMLDDLEQTWWGCNPDYATLVQQQSGQQAIAVLAATLQRTVSEDRDD
jgi:hypothetical protein